MTAPTGEGAQPHWSHRFLVNVAWSWAGTIASFLMGFFVSPLLIHRLGEKNYGLWAIAFAFVDYFNILDFGFKSATVQLLARYRAQGDDAGMNRAFNTAFVYYLSVGGGLFVLSILAAGPLAGFLHVTPELRPDFVLLVRIIAAGWTFGFVCNGVVAATEALQLFQTQNNLHILTQVLRTAGYVGVLYAGLGLPALGTVTTLTQFTGFGSMAVFLFRAAPALSFAPRLFDREIWGELRSFGNHAFVSGIGTFLLNQGPGFVIGRTLNEAAIGHFSLPNRILQYVVELITRIGSVTMPNATHMATSGRIRELGHFVTSINRYCFALFLPLALFLHFYGPQVLARWVTPEFAGSAGPLLTPFLLSTSLAVAAQFNSVSVLFGIAKHAIYSRLLVLEAITMLAGMALVIPQFGILGAAWVLCGAAIISRGLVTPLLLCRALDIPYLPFLSAIYGLPLLLAVPVYGMLAWLQGNWLPGGAWLQLGLAAGLGALAYYALFFVFGLQQSHRVLLMASLRRWVPLRN